MTKLWLPHNVDDIIAREEVLERREIWEKSREKFKKEHAACPECGSTSFFSTMVGYGPDPTTGEYRDENRVRCSDCGWSGRRYEMVEVDKICQ